jgi:REP-associated tyrosine transposase
MPRKPRPTAAGIYHIAARSQRGDKLFRDDADYLRFESELRLIVDVGTWRCISACAVPTHYHLLLDVGEGVLSKSVGRLNQRYAAAFNARYERRGHAFSERFLCVPVESDEQVLTVYRYIVMNAVQIGLCAKPEEWRWSSYPVLIGQGDRFSFADPALVVDLGGGVDRLRRFVNGE